MQMQQVCKTSDVTLVISLLFYETFTVCLCFVLLCVHVLRLVQFHMYFTVTN